MSATRTAFASGSLIRQQPTARDGSLCQEPVIKLPAACAWCQDTKFNGYAFCECQIHRPLNDEEVSL
jgi:hypothetical protein